ncbi:hypothetical protein RGQ13_12800 [Thalassotalea psychrophila]|uniref:Uncharacterized protein n=1 Tax=Thalassotalea psychrophila TaxID=3065647 RepID=A0ABY9TQ93_9GAMM|nr:hypothetical protein RGQ13_12800 [Colwelliaceae bacterium SQ149]
MSNELSKSSTGNEISKLKIILSFLIAFGIEIYFFPLFFIENNTPLMMIPFIILMLFTFPVMYLIFIKKKVKIAIITTLVGAILAYISIHFSVSYYS